MSSLLKTVFRTVILDDEAYQEWRERPNLFLRGIILIVIISLVAGLLGFVMDLANRVQPFDAAAMEEGFNTALDVMSDWMPIYEDPEAMEMIQGMFNVMVPMITELSQVRTPMPQGIVGFFNAFGMWISRSLTAIGGWLFYGALVLVFVKLLGGKGKLPEFYGMVALYTVPGLLALLGPISCVGWLFVLIGSIWSIVVYIKATAVVSGLDGGKAVLAVFAPFLSLMVLSMLVSALFILWFAILF
jgi:hypothetical protein